MKPIYLDNAATTPLDPTVLEAMMPLLTDTFANPSARHPAGAAARLAIDAARDRVARALCARPGHVTFTSGGTEANNLAVLGLARARAAEPGVARHVVVGPPEHPSVRRAALALRAEGFEVEVGRLDGDGALDLDHYVGLLRPETALVAQMLANNETGSVYPVEALARRVRAESPRAALFVDAVQAFGKLECAPTELGVDCVSISAHKVHGPKGAGALIGACELDPAPLLHGGGQEHGLRAGTENVAGIVGLGVAAELAEERREPVHAKLRALRRLLLDALASVDELAVLEPGASVAEPLPSVATVLIPGVPAEVLMHHLERRGVYVSAGSACSASSKTASPGLMALGLDAEQAARVLRFSFGRTTTPEEVERGAAALVEVARELNGAPA